MFYSDIMLPVHPCALISVFPVHTWSVLPSCPSFLSICIYVPVFLLWQVDDSRSHVASLVQGGDIAETKRASARVELTEREDDSGWANEVYRV